MAGVERGERHRLARECLERVGLVGFAGAYPHELSGGMQQRVALVLHPQVLLLDEPLASLDALLRARLQRELAAWRVGRTTLLVTHSIREALMLADRVVILSPRPGTVRREVRLAGAAPRSPSPPLTRLEVEIEGLLAGA